MIPVFYFIADAVFYMASTNIFLDTFFGRKNRKLSGLPYWTILFFAFFMNYINATIWSGVISALKVLTTVTLNLLLSFLITYTHRAQQLHYRFTISLLYYGLSAICELVSASLLGYFKPIIISTPNYLSEIYITLGSDIMLLLSLSLLYSFFRHKQRIISLSYLISLSIAPILSICILLVCPVDYYTQVAYSLTNVVLYSGLLLLNIFNFHLLDNIMKKYEQQEQLQHLQEQVESQTNKYKHLSSSYRETRRIVHDIKQHNNHILACLNNGEVEKAKSIIAKNSDEIDQRYIKVNTGNLVIDTFIGNLITIAQENEYSITYLISLDSDAIPVTEYDLTIILGNLVDNCLNACKALSNETPKINLFLKTDEKFFLLRLSNSIPSENVKDEFSLYHGYGIENIKRMTEKYRGLYYQETEGTIYCTSISIPIYRDTNGKLVISTITS